MRDYYAVLGLSATANEDEIKGAYRKAALKWHPDRNYGNVEEATKEFADAQTAYEVLSDTNERAWYDRHKDSILRGDAAQSESYEADDIVGLTAAQLISHFNSVTTSPVDDSTKGFFTVLRKLFDTIISEEIEACQQQEIDAPEFPSFGGSQSDDYNVRRFYSFWNTFNSNKTFSWAEQYAYHRAPDRRVRRVMEKENAKLRQAERQEYNETVHKLVSYMKKRDYRFIAKPQISAAQRQEELLSARKAQVEASRAANKANMTEFAEQSWQKVDNQQLAEEEMQAFEEWETEIECVACGKTFKSEKQYSSHEKSKKHIQTVKRLRWEMKKEAMELGLEYESGSEASYATAEEGELWSKGGLQPEPKNGRKSSPTKETPSPTTTPASMASTRPASLLSDDEYGTTAEFEARLEIDLDNLSLSDSEDETPMSKPVKKSKTKKKKAAKAHKNS
ncbi:Putative uncharacterized protein [Taphrina deformans PYCC 5710]|uniref:DnaJ-domain-containing protein n=1 Tax=Taphrina deformans (strain PYCC 5710 / ATCC 11124 / CBS 356.35 / IMI 108563 / JCM 9778 / NBRC 8474) TaxID=1097556 RepID=R4X7U1_TAPDE|nr:Putative uncharacterized protein [Taphrina deformans PYCC 5710]|eukprot:CCG81271.1 Putative uncharacterized protein [Taphrina deformans PYCC 5710]